MKKRFRNYETYALVTGAASGMGRIYSLRLAEKGYNVILVDINAKGLEETEALIRSSVQEVKILPIVQDLSALDAADQIFEKTEAAGCQVEVLVNNAGIMYCQGIAETLPQVCDRYEGA